MKICIVHEWLVTYAGSERVLAELIKIYPTADVFSVVDFLSDADRALLGAPRTRTSFIQKLPGARKHYRSWLPLMPLAVEQLDLSAYDIVISSSHAVAKGVLTGPDQLHISYVHSPIRYAWDLQHQYLRESNLQHGLKSWLARWLLHKIRIWDYRTSAGVDFFVANSRFIGRRIQKVYRRDAEVIHPPVDVDAFTLHRDKEDYYLAASRLVPYKRMDLIVEAFSKMPKRRLVVIGDGPELSRLQSMATPNVTILGYQSSESLQSHMQSARAFIFAAEEDFGIIPVEAQACGTPVIAYGKGGSLETVLAAPDSARTGILFGEQSADSIIAAVERFESLAVPITADACRAHAESFSAARFRLAFGSLVERRWLQFQRATCNDQEDHILDAR